MKRWIYLFRFRKIYLQLQEKDADLLHIYGKMLGPAEKQCDIIYMVKYGNIRLVFCKFSARVIFS